MVWRAQTLVNFAKVWRRDWFRVKPRSPEPAACTVCVMPQLPGSTFLYIGQALVTDSSLTVSCLDCHVYHHPWLKLNVLLLTLHVYYTPAPTLLVFQIFRQLSQRETPCHQVVQLFFIQIFLHHFFFYRFVCIISVYASLKGEKPNNRFVMVLLLVMKTKRKKTKVPRADLEVGSMAGADTPPQPTSTQLSDLPSAIISVVLDWRKV